MSDIVLPALPGTGAASDADLLSQIIYKPDNSGSPPSFEAINHLTNANLQAGQTLDRTKIRRRAAGDGRMIGQTGNIDFFYQIFPADDSMQGAYTAIPGCGIAFYLPYDARIVIFTYQIVIESQGHEAAGATNDVYTRLYLDGSRIRAAERKVPPAVTNTAPDQLDKDRDRVISGHWVCSSTSLGANSTATALTKGWHKIYYSLFSQAITVRCRIRNFKVIWFP